MCALYDCWVDLLSQSRQAPAPTGAFYFFIHPQPAPNGFRYLAPFQLRELLLDGLSRGSLRLLSLLSTEALEEVSATLERTTLDLDIFDIASVDCTPEKSTYLCHAFKVKSCLLTLSSNDLDAEMEDVGTGCEHRLLLGTAISSYLLKPLANLQDIANEQGLFYEPSLSPRSGYPMHPASIELEHENRLYQWDWDDIPVDEELICRLSLRDDRSFGLTGLQHKRDHAYGPVFSNKPIVDDSQSAEGLVSVEWKSECYIPVLNSTENCQVFEKVRIQECFEFHGYGLFDFTGNYLYKTPLDLEEEIGRLLNKASVSRRLAPLLRRVFAL